MSLLRDKVLTEKMSFHYTLLLDAESQRNNGCKKGCEKGREKECENGRLANRFLKMYKITVSRHSQKN